MTMPRIAGAIVLLIAAVLVISGVWEVLAGRNAPGVLGWGYLPRHRPKKSATWRSWQWRRNGVILLVFAVFIGNLGLTLLH